MSFCLMKLAPGWVFNSCAVFANHSTSSGLLINSATLTMPESSLEPMAAGSVSSNATSVLLFLLLDAKFDNFWIWEMDLNQKNTKMENQVNTQKFSIQIFSHGKKVI